MLNVTNVCGAATCTAADWSNACEEMIVTCEACHFDTLCPVWFGCFVESLCECDFFCCPFIVWNFVEAVVHYVYENLIVHCFIAAALEVDFNFCFCHHSSALCNFDESVVNLNYVFSLWSTYVVPYGSLVRNDIWSHTTVCDDIVDTNVALNVFTEIVCTNVHKFNCVESRTAVVWVAASVSCDTLEVEDCGVEAVGNGEACGVHCGWMECDTHIEFIECAAASHKALTCENFFCRAAVVDNCAFLAGCFELSLDTDSAANVSNCEEVMAASLTRCAGCHRVLFSADLLAHAWECVEFAEETDDWVALAPYCLDCCRNAACAYFNSKALFFHIFCDPVTSLVFAVCDFRIVPHICADLVQFSAMFFDCFISDFSEHSVYPP